MQIADVIIILWYIAFLTNRSFRIISRFVSMCKDLNKSWCDQRLLLLYFGLQYLIPIFAHLTLSNLPFLHRMPSFISSFLPPWKERAQFWYFSIYYFYQKRKGEKKWLIELRSSQYDDRFRLVSFEGFFMGICTNLNMTIFLRRSLETYVCHSFVFT